MASNTLAHENPASENTMRDWEQVRRTLRSAALRRRRSGRRSAPAPPLTPRPPSQRNTIDQVKLSLFQLTDFLNTFEASTKHKLGQLNEKMDRLERQVSHAEGAITAAVDQLKK